MYLIEDLFKRHGERLGLELIAGKRGMRRRIRVPEAHRPGLALSGYLKGFAGKRILIIGRVEIEYLRTLTPRQRIERLEGVLSTQTPAMIIARRFRPTKEMQILCEKNNIPLLRAQMSTQNLLSRLTLLLAEEFALSVTLHGTLVEVFGVGVMIHGFGGWKKRGGTWIN